MKPSIRQQAIFDCWEKEDCNVLIKAVAGSGKTTTLLKLLEMSGKKTLFLAFNKSIQMEIEEKLLKKGITNARAITMHSLGLMAIKRKVKYNIVSSKSFKLALETEKKNRHLFNNFSFKEKQFMTAVLINMNEVSRMYLTDDFHEINMHMETMSRPISTDVDADRIWEAFVRLRDETYIGSQIDIDFVDMIYIPVLKNLKIPVKPEHLMIDEAQDLNLAQHMLVDRLLDQGHIEKWIAVGDSNQSIYGFSGAFKESFEKFAEKENVKELPLDICYRCPQEILSEANEVYNVMQGFKSYPGIVEEKFQEDVADIPEGSLIICRNTAPLVSLFFFLLSHEKKVLIKGDDILGTIKKFLRPHNRKSLSQAYYDMVDESLRLAQKAEQTQSNLDRFIASEYRDNMGIFELMRSFFSGRVMVQKVGDMIDYLESLLLQDDSEAITLCTIHKSKGLENERVYILNEELIPSKFAITPEQRVQEINLKYVARTRASEELYYLSVDTEALKKSI